MSDREGDQLASEVSSRLYGGQCCEVLVYVSKAPEMEIKAGDYRGSVKINRLMVSASAVS